MKAILDVPREASALLVLAHGAGTGMNHPAMQNLAKALNEVGIGTLRYEFPYMEQGKKRPDPPAVAVARVAEAVELARKKNPGMKIYAGGKSFGARMTTTAASVEKIQVDGIICFSFPLHRPREPSITRAEHLARVQSPMLWIQGTRDDLSDLKLTREVAEKNHIQLKLIEGADHSYQFLKSSGKTSSDALREAAAAALDFIVKP